MNLPNTMGEHLLTDLGINSSQLGMLGSTYFLANLVFLIPAGMLLDWFDTRKIIVWGILTVTLGSFFFTFSSSFYLLTVGRLLMGAGSAFSFISCVKSANYWFPPGKMGLVVGMMSTMAMLGGFAAQSPSALLANWLGWKTIVNLYTALGVLIALAVYYRLTKQRKINNPRILLSSRYRDLKLVFSNKYNWYCGFYAGLTSQPIYLLGGFWGGLYLTQGRSLSTIESANVTSMIFIGAMAGTPLLGLLSDKIGSRRYPMIFSAIVTLIVMIVATYLPTISLMSLFILFLLIGLCASAEALSYPLITAFNDKALTGSAASIVSLCAIGSGALFQPLFGWLMDWNRNDELVKYNLINYQQALTLLILGIALSSIISLLLKDSPLNNEGP
jgi:MFS family permease